MPTPPPPSVKSPPRGAADKPMLWPLCAIDTGSPSSGGADKCGAGRGQGSDRTHRRHQVCRRQGGRRPVHVSAEKRRQGKRKKIDKESHQRPSHQEAFICRWRLLSIPACSAWKSAAEHECDQIDYGRSGDHCQWSRNWTNKVTVFKKSVQMYLNHLKRFQKRCSCAAISCFTVKAVTEGGVVCALGVDTGRYTQLCFTLNLHKGCLTPARFNNTDKRSDRPPLPVLWLHKEQRAGLLLMVTASPI